MLILQRRTGEAIVFRVADQQQEVRVILLNTQRGKATVGVEAPAAVRVLREELTPDPPERSRP